MKDLIDAIVALNEDEALELTKSYLAKGKSGREVFDAYQTAMAAIGALFEKHEYFVPELIMSGELMSAASDIIKPAMAGQGGGEDKKIGKALVATVQGDIHDIGKNIAAMMMEIAGVEVKDIGVDVPADKIVEAVKEWQPGILGLSGLLTLAYDPMKDVVAGLVKAGLRDKVKVLIGGGQIDENVRQYVGADVFATDAMVNVTYAKELFGGK
ncbi:MAG: cobalamin-dependent protein [Candidatus Adiutrix sp.]|jgi:5-methyltetrahydrofolate--homocysteine methyltransferase|nr:cobalamin-dependent protein [Candidatus Adiutrix sp.]